jgi:hypothetical protein
MNTYDPSDRIRYVHLACEEAVPPCSQLPAGYANRQVRHRLAAAERPALVVLPGGAADPDPDPAPLAPALRLA